MAVVHKSSEEILRELENEEKKTGCGRLKIFFGYAAGVGKTYAMLKGAHMAREQGIDVVAGYIEPHARPQTAALLEGLEQLEPLAVKHGGMNLRELDVDAVLNRRPQLVLVDELAHSNAPGCRHKKRYEDVEELLKAGIDVYTTVNVQHIESLNDIVAAVTKVTVRERIPDFIFDSAAQVELVDIEPSDLIKRFSEGEIYKSEQARTALKNFFTAENLTALREIALRRTADRVNRTAREARTESKGTYYTDEHILVCLSSSPSNPRIIRTAARLSNAFKGKFTALFVRAADFENYSEENRRRLRDNTKLAERLGAGIETVFGDDIAYQIAEFAKYAGVSKIVIGRSANRRRFGFIQPGFLDKLISLAANLDIYVIPDEKSLSYRNQFHISRKKKINKTDIGIIGLIWLLATLTALLFSYFDLGQADMATIYILSVLIAGVVTSDRLYSIALAACNVLAFDYLFVPPQFTFSYTDYRYTGTFLIMFAAAFITASLSGKIKKQSEQSAQTAYRTKILLDTNQLLQKAGDIDEIAGITSSQLSKLSGRTVVYYGAGEDDTLLEPAVTAASSAADTDKYLSANEQTVALWVFKNGRPAGMTTNTLGNAECLYMPIKTKDRIYGVMGIALADNYMDTFENSIILSILGECSLAVEKELYNKKRHEAAAQIQNEKLRNNFLRSISHDLRTPLTGIMGNADFLIRNGSSINEEKRKNIYSGIYSDAGWLIDLVENILSITRIENGGIRLNRQTELIDDVINEAIYHVKPKKKKHVIRYTEPADMYFSRIDARLIMQVIVNIIDNALKYTPDNSIIEIKAEKRHRDIAVSIADNGYGICDDRKEKIFRMFYSGDSDFGDGRRGMGIGLALCRSIITAHGGAITVRDNYPQGAVFVFTLPLEEVTVDEQTIAAGGGG